MLEHIDDGGTHYQGQAGAYGKDGRHPKDQQAPGNQEAAAHAKETAQGAYNQAQQYQEQGIDHHVGVGEEHINLMSPATGCVAVAVSILPVSVIVPCAAGEGQGQTA